jgi:hypothetical protein
MTIVRFNARMPAWAATRQDLALPPPVRQPLGGAGDGYGQGLAAALQGIQRTLPRTMPALGDDLMAEALLRYAQRNSAGGQAAPLAASGQGGGYGPLGASGAQTSDVGGAPGGGAPSIDQLNLNRASPAWTAYLQSILPRIGPAPGGGYGGG